MKKILLHRHTPSSSGGGDDFGTSIYFSLYVNVMILDIRLNPKVVLIGDLTVTHGPIVDVDYDFYNGDPIDFAFYNIPSGTSVRIITSGIDMLNIESINGVTIDDNYNYDLTFIANSSTERYDESSLSFIPPAYSNYDFSSVYLTDPSLLGYLPVNVLMTFPNNTNIDIQLDIHL